jgi:hypothetical protein
MDTEDAVAGIVCLVVFAGLPARDFCIRRPGRLRPQPLADRVERRCDCIAAWLHHGADSIRKAAPL